MPLFKGRIGLILFTLIYIAPVYAENPASKEYVDQKFAIIQQQIDSLNGQGITNQVAPMIETKKGNMK